MDQPGNGHFALHMSQQTLNGRDDHHGRAGYEGNGHFASGSNGNGQGANGFNGYVAASSGGQHDQQGHPDQQVHGQQAQGGSMEYAEYAEYIEASAAAQDASAVQDASSEREASADGITADGITSDQAIQDGALADGGATDGGATDGGGAGGQDAAILVPPQSAIQIANLALQAKHLYQRGAQPQHQPDGEEGKQKQHQRRLQFGVEITVQYHRIGVLGGKPYHQDHHQRAGAPNQ